LQRGVAFPCNRHCPRCEPNRRRHRLVAGSRASRGRSTASRGRMWWGTRTQGRSPRDSLHAKAWMRRKVSVFLNAWWAHVDGAEPSLRCAIFVGGGTSHTTRKEVATGSMHAAGYWARSS
jgi:hypothetical protein